MSRHPFTTFGTPNRRLILLLIGCHLLWSVALLGLLFAAPLLEPVGPWLSAAFIALQLFAAVQLLLPALGLHPEKRSRGFYLFWGTILGLSLGGIHRIPLVAPWDPLLSATKSALLLLIATLTGAVLARSIRRLVEIIPVCLVMTLADLASWFRGPTAGFAREIEDYYRAPSGPPPLIDMVLVKLAVPGSAALVPVFGISDWIMVVFFAVVARHHGVNDNLIGEGETPSRVGRYLPVSAVALFAAIALAQGTGLFIPALPLIALIMLLWYAGRFLLRRQT